MVEGELLGLGGCVVVVVLCVVRVCLGVVGGVVAEVCVVAGGCVVAGVCVVAEVCVVAGGGVVAGGCVVAGVCVW